MGLESGVGENRGGAHDMGAERLRDSCIPILTSDDLWMVEAEIKLIFINP